MALDELAISLIFFGLAFGTIALLVIIITCKFRRNGGRLSRRLKSGVFVLSQSGSIFTNILAPRQQSLVQHQSSSANNVNNEIPQSEDASSTAYGGGGGGVVRLSSYKRVGSSQNLYEGTDNTAYEPEPVVSGGVVVQQVDSLQSNTPMMQLDHTHRPPLSTSSTNAPGTQSSRTRVSVSVHRQPPSDASSNMSSSINVDDCTNNRSYNQQQSVSLQNNDSIMTPKQQQQQQQSPHISQSAPNLDAIVIRLDRRASARARLYNMPENNHHQTTTQLGLSPIHEGRASVGGAVGNETGETGLLPPPSNSFLAVSSSSSIDQHRPVSPIIDLRREVAQVIAHDQLLDSYVSVSELLEYPESEDPESTADQTIASGSVHSPPPQFTVINRHRSAV